MRANRFGDLSLSKKKIFGDLRQYLQMQHFCKCFIFLYHNFFYKKNSIFLLSNMDFCFLRNAKTITNFTTKNLQSDVVTNLISDTSKKY